MLLLAALLLPAAPAPAVTLSGEGPLEALTAAGGAAYAVVGSDSRSTRYELVRATGGGADALGVFGAGRAEWADIAADRDGQLVVGWGELTSPGYVQYLREAPRSAGENFSAGVIQASVASGFGQLAAGAGGQALAYPDRAGDATLAVLAPGATRATATRLTHDAPYVRHAPRDLAAAGDGFLVLDRAQTRTHTSLRVLGKGAPAAAVVAVGARRALESSLAVDGAGRHVVAYAAGGRVQLALAGPSATRWRNVALPRTGVPEGTPSVALGPSGRVRVAFAARVRGQLDVFTAALAFDGAAPRPRALTSGRPDELAPRIAALPGGGAYVAFTRRDRRTDKLGAELRRIP